MSVALQRFWAALRAARFAIFIEQLMQVMSLNDRTARYMCILHIARELTFLGIKRFYSTLHSHTSLSIWRLKTIRVIPVMHTRFLTFCELFAPVLFFILRISGFWKISVIVIFLSCKPFSLARTV